MRILIWGLLVIFCVGIPPVHGENPSGTMVSLINLLSDPADYDGHTIRAVGFIEWTADPVILYLNHRYADYDLTHNGILIENFQTGNREDFTGRYCLIEGTFRKHNRNLNHNTPGRIQDVKVYEIRSETNWMNRQKRSLLR